MMEVIKNSLNQSHDYIRQVVRPGDTVVDATAGNGNDSAFLAELVGSEGRVYSFDIQDQALDKTRKRLQNRQTEDRVVLVKDGHQNMDRYITTKVRAVMFNLGYLPGGNHTIGTQGETTIQAIEKSMEMLEVNGMISIVVYYGGDSGFDEKNMVMEYIKGIDCKRFVVMKTEFMNQVNCPPILICIEKLKEKDIRT